MDCEKLLAFTDQLWILSRHGSPSQDCLNQWFYRPAYPNMYAEVSAQNVKCVLSKNVLFVDNGEKKMLAICIFVEAAGRMSVGL